MAVKDKKTQARNQRLDDLQAATETWAEKETKRLNDQSAFGKRVLKGRTGSERLAQASVTSTKELVVDQINDFLTGD